MTKEKLPINKLNVLTSPSEREKIKNIEAAHNKQKGSRFHKTGDSWFGADYSTRPAWSKKTDEYNKNNGVERGAVDYVLPKIKK